MTTQYTFDENIVSDLHKDARGFRPTSGWWSVWKDLSDDAKQETWDSLCQELSETMDRERRAQADAMIALHQRIQGAMLLGAGNEVQALKWIMESEEFSEHDLEYGADYFCYHFGISYDAKNELPIQEAMKQMLVEVV